MKTGLNNEQKKSEPIELLTWSAEAEHSTLQPFIATTCQEQRDIAQYIKEKYPSYRIIDCSKKEESIMFNAINAIEEENLIIINLQDLFLGPYGDVDDETTITLDDKIAWYSSIEDCTKRNELFMLRKLNFIRDSFFRNFGKRNCLIGMSQMLWFRLISPLFAVEWPDLYSMLQIRINFNTDQNFVMSPSKYTDYFDNSQKGEDDLTGEKIYYSDMIYVHNGRIVRLPNYYQYLKQGNGKLDESKIPLLMKNLDSAPEVVYSKKIKIK